MCLLKIKQRMEDLQKMGPYLKDEEGEILKDKEGNPQKNYWHNNANKKSFYI
jgi:hypothetical protein